MTLSQALGLVPPSTNDIGQTVWPVPESQIKQQFRSLSLWVHPDKNENSELSQAAFGRLTAAFKCLCDISLRNEYIKDFVQSKNVARVRGWVPMAKDQPEGGVVIGAAAAAAQLETQEVGVGRALCCVSSLFVCAGLAVNMCASVDLGAVCASQRQA